MRDQRRAHDSDSSGWLIVVHDYGFLVNIGWLTADYDLPWVNHGLILLDDDCLRIVIDG